MTPFETRLVVLSENAKVTINDLISYSRSLQEPITIKETCFGMLIEGEKEIVQRTIRKLKEYAPFCVFSKERGYSIGEKRKCRRSVENVISGAPRPGFFQLEFELKPLELVGQALESLDSNPNQTIRVERKEKLNEDEARTLVKKVLSNHGM